MRDERSRVESANATRTSGREPARPRALTRSVEDFISVDTLVLQALFPGDAPAAVVKVRIEAMTNGHTKLRVGRIHLSLRALEAQGLLQSRTAGPIRSRPGRPRIHFSLTERGAQVARAQRARAANVFGLRAEPRVAEHGVRAAASRRSRPS